jgi:hypothetical protein
VLDGQLPSGRSCASAAARLSKGGCQMSKLFTSEVLANRNCQIVHMATSMAMCTVRVYGMKNEDVAWIDES